MLAGRLVEGTAEIIYGQMPLAGLVECALDRLAPFGDIMKKPPSMATRFQSSIARTEAVGGTAEVKIMFIDDSGFSFQAVSGDPKPVVTGSADSLAQEFAAGTTKFTFLAAGVQLAFKDGSSCNMNFGKVIGAKPLQ